jgi:hypothetical protein
MKTITTPVKLLFISALVFYAGCDGSDKGPIFPISFNQPDSRFGPAKIDILPISSLTQTQDSSHNTTVNAYVSMLDAFDSQIKAPATFRFELFQYVQRSSDPKGKRLNIWPDIDLTDPGVNNSHWQDFLRAYQFSLPLKQRPGEACVLRVTCLSHSGKRLSADFLLKPARNP